eukprot:2650194-Rhodomonas_salina.1
MGRRIEVGMWRAGKGNPDLKKTATDHPKTNATDRFSGTKSTAFMGFAFDFGVLFSIFKRRGSGRCDFWHKREPPYTLEAGCES